MSGPSFFRAFPTELEQTGPTQLTGRLVPYDVVAWVLDRPDGGKPDIYQEGFRPGAFATQAGSRERGVINRIGLVHTHEDRGLGYLGPFIRLRDQDDGLYGDARILPSKAPDLAALIAEGVKELSIEFRVPAKAEHTHIDGNGVRWRTRAHLDQVALEPRGAYRTAEILAVRAELDDEQRHEAEANASAQAEAAAADEKAADDAALAAAVEAEAAAAEERRRRFTELVDRLPAMQERQDNYVRAFGITRTEGYHRR